MAAEADEGKPRVSIDTNRPTVIEDGDGDKGDAAAQDAEGDDASSSPPEPLYHSSRLKGYMTLFVAALYNYFAAFEKYRSTKAMQDAGASPYATNIKNFCLALDDGLAGLVARPYDNYDRLEYTMGCAMTTVVFTGLIILIHFDFCTPLRMSAWQKAFGPHGKVELALILFFVIFWMIATWFNTTIRGPGGEGKEQYNLYFSSWLCTWASMWTFERWCTTSGRASFEQFVRSWPNRCPLWIVVFILSLTNFFFVLDTNRNWEQGSVGSPYVFKLYSEVSGGEWFLLYFSTCSTWVLSLAWALAEIFRLNVNNAENVKSDVEFFVEGLTVHVIAIVWIITVCIVTMPGGAASLIGNLYFTTWSTLFSVVGTLMWFVRDWRQNILGIIQAQQDIYDEVKRTCRIREEERRAKLAAKERDQSGDGNQSKTNGSRDEESKVEEDEEVLCEDDPDIDDDDITLSIASGWRGPSSVTSGSGKAAPSDKTNPSDSEVTTTSSLFMSAISYFYSGTGIDEEKDDIDDGDDQNGD